MNTLGQKRAKFALEKVKSINIDKEFKSLCNGATASILQNGFGQTLAFWFSKGDGKHRKLLNIVCEWIKSPESQIKDFSLVNCEEGFIKQLNIVNQSTYLRAQKEALALLEWVKRYVSALVLEDNDV